jgi:DNA-binding GntR family transcriptional regulator
MARKAAKKRPATSIDSGQRLSDLAFNLLHQAITRCELIPGQIVSEPQLEKQFDLGKVSIRLAMDRLIQLQLVKPIHRRGFEIGPISVSDLRDNFELRKLVEPPCFAMASQRSIDVNALRELDQLMLSHPEPVDRKTEAIVINANREFHMTVIRACGNERTNALMTKILDDIDRAYYYGLMRHPKFSRIQRDHALIVKALEARDSAEAERLARAHIEQGYSIVIDSILMGVSLAGNAPKL